MKQILLYIVMLLLFTGCKDSFEYHLIAEGNVTRIEIIGGGFGSPAQRIFYLDDGSLCTFDTDDYQGVKIGDYIYVYYRKWSGKVIRSTKP